MIGTVLGWLGTAALVVVVIRVADAVEVWWACRRFSSSVNDGSPSWCCCGCESFGDVCDLDVLDAPWDDLLARWADLDGHDGHGPSRGTTF